MNKAAWTTLSSKQRTKIRTYKRKWYAKNKTDQAAKGRQRYAENRDEVTAYRNAYNAKQREEGGKIQSGREWLDDQKRKPCKDCGGTFPPCAMDFDHVRGEKLFTLSRVRATFFSDKVKGRALEEIAKCDLVCACCHRVRTEDRRRNAS